jgi:hypothetical protein
MVTVTVQADRAIFEVEGMDRLWSLRSRLEIPLAHITEAASDPDQVGRWWRLQLPTSHFSLLTSYFPAPRSIPHPAWNIPGSVMGR